MKFPEQFRAPMTDAQFESKPGEEFGIFFIPPRAANGRALKVIACADWQEDGIEWEHVSVSLAESKMNDDRQPSWKEMCIVKGLFFEASECVVQFHPPESDYVNTHQGVLHLWKWTGGTFPMPPTICV